MPSRPMDNLDSEAWIALAFLGILITVGFGIICAIPAVVVAAVCAVFMEGLTVRGAATSGGLGALVAIMSCFVVQVLQIPLGEFLAAGLGAVLTVVRCRRQAMEDTGH